MAIKKVRTAHIPLVGRHWFYRMSVILMMTFGLMLFVMSKTNNPAIATLRTHINDMVAPLLSVASRPMDAVHNAGIWVSDIVHMHEENIALKNERVELLKWQAAAQEMKSENDALRSLLNVVQTGKTSYATARVVSDIGGPYVHSALINGGSNNGIKKDEAAISENGLLGRIVDVGASSARILLLGDINSRVPVITENTHEKAILIGNNTDTPTLSYLPTGSKIKVGDHVVTSGDGGVFPKDIPVGVVTSVENGAVKIQPFVDASKVEFISVVDYSF